MQTVHDAKQVPSACVAVPSARTLRACRRTHMVLGRVLAAARTAGGDARQAGAAGGAARGAAEAVDDEPLAIVGERGPARAKFFHLVQAHPGPGGRVGVGRALGDTATALLAGMVQWPAPAARLTGAVCARFGGTQRGPMAGSCSARRSHAPPTLAEGFT